MSENENMHGGAHTSDDVMVKKLVRLALASEYARLPIRRNEITQKVLGENGWRKFKAVFDEAQRQLKTKFGMEMAELPAKEQITVQQRRGELLCFPFRGVSWMFLHHLDDSALDYLGFEKRYLMMTFFLLFYAELRAETNRDNSGQEERKDIE